MDDKCRPEDLIIREAKGLADMQRIHLIRRTVFVEEQGIPQELEEDGCDEAAFHVIGLMRGIPAATGRLIADADEDSGTLARIAVMPAFRGRGLGKRTIFFLEDRARVLGLSRVELHPHAYLKGFYCRLGYESMSGTDFAGTLRLIRMFKVL